MLGRGELRFYKFVKWYQFVRFIKLLQSVLLLFDLPVGTLYVIRMVGLQLTVIDALICLLVIGGAIHILRSKNEILRMSNKGKQQLRKELLILGIACFMRIIFDECVLFLALLIAPENCPSETVFNLAYLTVGQIICHLLPIYVIAKMQIQSRDYHPSTMLLSSSSEFSV